MTNTNVHFEFNRAAANFQPGETLDCEFRLVGEGFEELRAIETSVLWKTSGKGNEDIGVHFFRRRTKKELIDISSENVHRFSTTLPKSPLSYVGQILSVHWLVRVKLFYNKGKRSVFDHPIRLGSVISPLDLIGVTESDSDNASEGEE